MCFLNLNEFSFSNLMETLTYFSIVIGGGFSVHRWNMNLKLKRAEYIKNLFNEIRSNPKIVFYLFEYDSIWYNENFHNSKELESNVDYTLSYFSYLCYLKRNNIITNSEFNYFKYELERILTNRQFKNYIYNLYHFSKKVNQPISFVDLFQYAKDNNYFDQDFWDKDSKKYIHLLNF